jgi:hypothetical protein
MKIPQHIKKAGELLVQYKLVKYGFDSAVMIADSDIDLVAYSSTAKKTHTIQVKTNEEPTPFSGSGKLALSWHLVKDSPVDIVTVADLSTDSVWLFSYSEFADLAQHHSSNGNFILCMYVEENIITRSYMGLKSEFEYYLFEERVNTFF